jgi:hypothetical protein
VNKDPKQVLVNSSTPVDTSSNEAIQDTVITDLTKGSAWTDLQAREFEDVILHRKRWSNVLLALVSLIIVMDFVVMVLTGTNALSYTSSLAIPAFIGSSILEIFGLSYIVVQYLFPGAQPSGKPIDRSGSRPGGK